MPLLKASEVFGFSYYTLRNWALTGKIPYVRAGGSNGKIMLNVDKLIEFLNNGENNDQ